MGFSTREQEQRLHAVGAPSSTRGNHHAAAVAQNGPTEERTRTARPATQHGGAARKRKSNACRQRRGAQRCAAAGQQTRVLGSGADDCAERALRLSPETTSPPRSFPAPQLAAARKVPPARPAHRRASLAAPGATRRARGRRGSAPPCRRGPGTRRGAPPHCSARGGGAPTSPAGPHDPFLLQDEGGAVHQAGHHGHAQAQRHGGGAGALRRPVPRCRTDRHPHRGRPGPALPAAVLRRDRPALRAPPAEGGSALGPPRGRQQDDVIPSRSPPSTCTRTLTSRHGTALREARTPCGQREGLRGVAA